MQQKSRITSTKVLILVSFDKSHYSTFQYEIKKNLSTPLLFLIPDRADTVPLRSVTGPTSNGGIIISKINLSKLQTIPVVNLCAKGKLRQHSAAVAKLTHQVHGSHQSTFQMYDFKPTHGKILLKAQRFIAISFPQNF